MVSALGYGTTGLSVGQRVFGLTDWTRDGTLAEYAAVEARNLAPLPGDVDFTVGASLPISGLTAWQGLFEHGRLQVGQSVLVHGAAGGVGSMVTQLAREAGAYVIGTGRAADRQTALDFGAHEFLDLDNDALEDVGGVDLVFDVIGGDIGKRSAGLVRPGGTLVTIAGPPEARPADGLAVDFVVEADRAQLSEIVQRVRDGRLRTIIGQRRDPRRRRRRLQPDRAGQGQDDHPGSPIGTRPAQAAAGRLRADWAPRVDQPADLRAPGRIRTCDTRFRRAVLYPLSYGGSSADYLGHIGAHAAEPIRSAGSSSRPRAHSSISKFPARAATPHRRRGAGPPLARSSSAGRRTGSGRTVGGGRFGSPRPRTS